MKHYIERARAAFERGRQFATMDVWHIGRPGEAVPEGFVIKQVRVAILLISNLAEGGVMLRASALTFATILSIVPFLAVMFYVIQTFDLGDSLYIQLQKRLESGITTATDYIPGFNGDGQAVHAEGTDPLADLGDWGGPRPSLTDIETTEDAESPLAVESVADRKHEQNKALQREVLRSIFRRVGSDTTDSENDVIDPIERIAQLADEAAQNRSAMSIAGVVLLLTTVFGLMRNIEKSFNGIWGVRRTRSWYRMFSDYVIITLMLPFVATAVLAVTAALQSETITERLGPLAYGVRGLQYGMVIIVFSTLYFAVPNTRVKVEYALLGGAVAGILWLLLSWAYVEFQIGVTRYNLVFSTFAQFPVLLMWVYISWMILLFGAELSYAYQNERTFAMERLADGASYAYREALGLRTLLEVGRRFDAGEGGFNANESAAKWNVPSRLVNDALQNLEEAGLVNAVATDPVTYRPSKPIEKIRIGEVLTALREVGEDPSQFRADDRYRKLYDVLDDTDSVFDGATVKQLLARIQLALVEENPAKDSEAEAS